MLDDGTIIAPPVAPDERTDEQKSLDNIKSSIRLIEGLFHAVNAGTFPLKWHDDAMRGMNFLNQMHSNLVFQLPKDEVEKLRANAAMPITPAVA